MPNYTHEVFQMPAGVVDDDLQVIWSVLFEIMQLLINFLNAFGFCAISNFAHNTMHKYSHYAIFHSQNSKLQKEKRL